MSRCPFCGKKLTECFEDFVYYLECKNCFAHFTEEGKYFEWN